MCDGDMGTVVERTVLTPAERAVLVEQAQAMQVGLRSFIEMCNAGRSPSAIQAYDQVAQANDYITSIINTKVMHTLERDHQEGRDH